MAANSSSTTSPILALNQITDIYTRRNFQNLREYFLANNQLVGFKFFDVVYPAAQTGITLPHGLSYTPSDVFVTRQGGPGVVTWNYAKFDGTNLNFDVSDAIRLRFFAGSYWNLNSQNTDPSIPAGASSQTSSVMGVVPPGVIVAFGGISAPTGYLMCLGQVVQRSTYAKLFSAIGTNYGAGDGSTTFAIPNMGGMFLRGAGTQTINGVIYSTGMGNLQTDAMQGHWHTSTNQTGGTGNNFGACNTNNSSGVQTNGINVIDPRSDGVHGTPRTSAETRPVNIGVNYIIKT